MIGAMYFANDSTSATIYSDFEHFNKYQLMIGAEGYALAQAPIITFFILNFYFANNRKAIVLNIILSAVLIFLCFGGVIYMNTKSCIGYSTYWTANFMIFWVFDLITFQILYSFIFMLLLPKNYKILLEGAQTEETKKDQGVIVVHLDYDNTENAGGNSAINKNISNASFSLPENKDNLEEAKIESEALCVADFNEIDVNVAG
ncbi:hypothetical protein SteCoe_28097 [Stentor coeruleus]|uniref:Uncharacterized protein n=1 Tax=Stentor coeruleus TaxID=5963 RepID=A0A1R2B910_9CILI|nr:hypothetical protein SteCoe_28097 [Stentor coeruleus]